jgi:hypothetical protein
MSGVSALDPSTTKAISDLIVQSVQAFESAPVKSLNPDDLQEFTKIRNDFEDCLKETHSYCVNYEAFYVYMRDGIEVLTIEELQENLARNDFDSIVDVSRRITISCYDLCLKINTFIRKLEVTYSRATLFTWSFITSIVGCVAGIAIITAACIIPGAQLFAISGAFIALASGTKIATKVSEHGQNMKLDESLRELKLKLEHLLESVGELRAKSATLTKKVQLVKLALGMDKHRGTEAKYLKEMCEAFEELQLALNTAISTPSKKSNFLSQLSSATMTTGVVTAGIAATAVLSSNTAAVAGEAVEHTASVLSCTIM